MIRSETLQHQFIPNFKQIRLLHLGTNHVCVSRSHKINEVNDPDTHRRRETHALFEFVQQSNQIPQYVVHTPGRLLLVTQKKGGMFSTISGLCPCSFGKESTLFYEAIFRFQRKNYSEKIIGGLHSTPFQKTRNGKHKTKKTECGRIQKTPTFSEKEKGGNSPGSATVARSLKQAH